MFSLPVFPEGGLASSVITTVWVGVLVLCFFNLRFGWVLSGLVVPGYVVPLLIVKPLAALVILVEAILAYLLVWLFSEKLAPGRYPSLFGRDRFMGLILSSIAVRLAMDGWALPHAADWLAANFNQRLDWQSDLQSFGLVIISLLANQFWKPGLARGLFSGLVVTGLTFLIVRYGLMELTNFRMSGVTYLYEGLASSVLASPKAYMILVLTALYASHMNVRYGWDFSGILIPALIALQWYQPTKIVTSFVEAAAIYVIARQLLKTPWLANVTMEGANKILLFFNISFVLKLIVGHLLVWLAWDVKTTDFYGFGYLLSTLLAIKAHDKDIFPRLMHSTLQVSLIGAGLGNLAGLALAALLPASAANAAAVTGRASGRMSDLVVRAVGDSALRRASAADGALAPQSFATLEQTVATLEAGLPPLQAGSGATASGWRVEALGGSRLALARVDGQGADLLLLDTAARSDLAIVVGDASAPGMALAGLDLQRELGARWLVLTSPAPPQGGEDMSVLAAFRAAHDGVELDVSGGTALEQSTLALADRSATVIDLTRLRAAVPDTAIVFSAERGAAEAIDDAPARLTFSQGGLHALLARALPAPRDPAPCVIPDATDANARALSLPQRLYLREQIIRPLLPPVGGEGPPDEVLAARGAADGGYVLERCEDAGGRLLFALTGPAGTGAYLIDPAGRRDRIVVSALRPDALGRPGAGGSALAEEGVAVARAARASLLALAPRELAYDGSQQTAFGVILQTALDQLGDAPAAVLQLRAQPRLEAQVAEGRTFVTMDRLGTPGPLERDLLATVAAAGLDPVLTRRSREAAGFEAFSQTALLYLNHSMNKRYAVLFVPPGKGE